ncbi:MFS transporter [Cryptosporangium sp. NPDC051539]|uniref:MFS transporter n=1 Tax=Cryptosporangium sp. NPDC051539 TaxID=3363962 RepID=UPI0037B8C672
MTPISRSRRTIVFATVLLGMLLSALDQTLVSSALPTIVGDLGGSSHVSWIVTSYLLAQTVAAVLAGKFGDLYGRKRIFQLSVVVFLVGSFFCGLANGMGMLIAARAVQGIGSGGLVVTASALIGEIIPLRERGRYQGALGAVFGVTTVIGPLLGGVFTDHLSWRWAFYVNVPLGILVVLVAARTIPALATSWGGAEYAWTSATIVGLFAVSIPALAAFVWAERRTPEPILPIRLFRSRVFSVASALSFLVGFAMPGALSFLPSFLQYVGGASATLSGVRTLPLVLGLLITSVTAGQIVGRTGIYKPFPIAGTSLIGLGLFLLSRMDEQTSIAVQSASMFVLGAGIGLLLALLLPQVGLRGATREAARSAGEGFGMPTEANSDSQLEVLVSQIVRRDPGAVRAGPDLPTAWGLIVVNVRDKALGGPARQADIEHRLHLPHGVLTSFFDHLADAGYLTRTGDRLELTERGQRAATAIVDGWTAWLSGQLSNWDSDQVRTALRRIARRLLIEDPVALRESPRAT